MKFKLIINKIHNKLIYYIKKIPIFFYGQKFQKFGKNNAIWFPVRMYGKKNISIGNNCNISAFLHVWGGGGVEIGDNVMIAPHVSITSLTHDYNSPSMRFAAIIAKKVTIEDDVWIGSGAIILPGITIGHGAVIGAGTVVTKDVPSMAIVVGNPGRIIKWRNIQSH